jgi:NAD+ synthase
MASLVSVSDQTLQLITGFIQQTFANTVKKKAVVAVSGGIDSAVSLTLACKALGPAQVYPLFLPFEKQSVQDSQIIASFNEIPVKNWQTYNIERLVSAAQSTIGFGEDSELAALRLGNIMARARMIIVYDVARQLDALVCGTENKSEKYLSYFTRFGDEASDLEPIQHLYKTQVRELARLLTVPEIFLVKAPSAGLWQAQEDEQELGFSYQDADQVLVEYIDGNLRSKVVADLVDPSRYPYSPAGLKTKPVWQETVTTIATQTGIAAATVEAVLWRVESTQFKHQVPYTM